MKKVLLVYSSDVSNVNSGGIKNYVVEFVNSNKESTIELLAVCNGNPPLLANNVKTTFFKTRRKPVIISFLLQVILAIIKGKICSDYYDTIIYNRHEEALLGFIIKSKRQLLLIHGSIKYGYNVWPSYVAFLNSCLERCIVSIMDCTYILLKNEEYGMPFYKSRYSKIADKIFYAPVPIAKQFIKPQKCLEKYAGDILKVLFAGRVVENPKNVMKLPEYAKTFLEKDIEIIMTVAGTGPDLAVLKEKVRQMGLTKRFVFLGNVQHQDLPDIISKNHISFVLSDFEGICMSALESLAMGVPVAAYPVGDIPEYIHDMKNGVILNLNDGIEASAEKIVHFLSQYNYSAGYHDYISSYFPPACFSFIDV